MSQRPQLSPFKVIEDGDMSANITSDVTIIQKLSMISYTLTWTGSSPVGTIKVQVSNDYSQNADGSVRNPGTWVTLTLNVAGVPTSSIAISGSTGDGFIDVTQTGAFAMRLLYTRSSGSGTMQAVISAKVA